MKDQITEIKKLITEAEEDAVRFYDKKNKAAGRRVRKALQEVKKLAQEVRMDVLNNSK